MTVTVPQVEASRPESLTQSATELGTKASNLATQIDTQRSTINGLQNSWKGAGSDAAVAKVQPTIARMQQIHDALGRAQAVLQAGGTQLSADRTNVVNTVSQLTGQGWQVSPDGSVSARPGGPLDQYAKASRVNEMKVLQLAATNSTTVKTLLARFDTTDRQLSQNLRTAAAGLDGAPTKLGIGDLPQDKPPYDDGSQIPTGKSPEEVNKWWTSLNQQQRDQLLHDWPDRLGNLNGIPVADRSEANKAVMKQDLDRPAQVAAARGVSVEEVLAHPEQYGMAGEMMNRYNNAVQVQKGLMHNTERTGAPVFLQVYEPDKFGGAGRAAIAIGNPDKAANTAVVVPGTSHSVTEGWLSSDDAAHVYNEMAAADRSRQPSVIAWMGYDAPDSLFDPQVGQTGLAHQGGALLAADVNALSATHDPEVGSHITAIGHSYGSTTVADAAAGYGMHIDDAVLVGCPGTDLAHNASDFHLNPGGHVFVGSASTDPITLLGGMGQAHVPGTGVTVALGADPSVDGFGSTRFKAEVPGLTVNDHSHYYDPGTESLFSIADIASGHGDALEHDGMTASHRKHVPSFIPGLPSTDFDPEVFRPPTGDHYHK
ncbi:MULTISPECIES: alpha/beta hydrolase [unclassified Mycolicibacterium]|uniref:alpha/beta hydrolase n=1 Tax=unclassified Mycolicibacterium TaxID=2636767 RepID=UPI0028167C8F|nr:MULTISPECIES: alpha/beta hydrolase [unclassified Mycolicibacterium]